MTWLSDVLMVIAIGTVALCSAGMKLARWFYRRSRSVRNSPLIEQPGTTTNTASSGSTVPTVELSTETPSELQKSNLTVVFEELDSSFGNVCCAVCHHEWLTSWEGDYVCGVELECPKCGAAAGSTVE